MDPRVSRQAIIVKSGLEPPLRSFVDDTAPSAGQARTKVFQWFPLETGPVAWTSAATSDY